ncbi:type II toxin-antitoxin system VapB family antitoxin [Sabulicella rubraurantiaca]|uniref:type II toxin-antitoxin system VapB family antitoxin n=1 Tax=Sabulicella rubraurantiaca TaxID=2811429 RepID=UPI0038B6549F
MAARPSRGGPLRRSTSATRTDGSGTFEVHGGDHHLSSTHARSTAVRTSITVDEDLLAQARQATGLSSAEALVEEGLRLLVRLKGGETRQRDRDLPVKRVWAKARHAECH